MVNADRLYERLAATVRGQIEARTFRPGDRLPSVRHLSRTNRVSVSTVLDAYRLLEDQGLVRARPQSGYYVRATSASRPPEPSTSAPTAHSQPFERNDLIESMATAMGRTDMTQLGFALPIPELLPHERLARLTSRVAREHPEASYGYGPVGGYRELREQIAQRAFAAGASVSPDEVVVTTGCQEGLCLALQASVPAGGLVAVESPCHWGILQAIDYCGLRSREISTHSLDGISIPALQAAIEEGRETGDPIHACLVCPNFQNPLGFLMTDFAKQALVDLANQEGIVLIEDDVYGDLGFEGERPRVLRSFAGADDVLLCSSFSKTLAPGYRIGWCIAKNRHGRVRRLKHALSVGAPSLPQLVIAEFLSNGGYDQFVRRARKSYAASSHAVSEAVARHFPEETRLSHPQGGFVLWAELPEKVDSAAIYSEAVAKGILVAPGKLFSAHEGYGSYLRLTTSLWTPRIERAIVAVGQMLAASMRP